MCDVCQVESCVVCMPGGELRRLRSLGVDMCDVWCVCQVESCAGYGHWVLTTLLDVRRQDTEAFRYCIKQMAAIPAAADALTRYTGT